MHANFFNKVKEMNNVQKAMISGSAFLAVFLLCNKVLGLNETCSTLLGLGASVLTKLNVTHPEDLDGLKRAINRPV